MIRLTPDQKAEINKNLKILTGREMTEEDDVLVLITDQMVRLREALIKIGEQADESSGAIRNLRVRWNQRDW